MKVKVLNKFTDKYDFSKEYKPGDVIDISEESRIDDLLSRGLIEIEVKEEVKDEKPEVKKEPKKASK